MASIRCQPFEKRQLLYGKVIRLRQQGLNYRDILGRVRRADGLRIVKARTIYDWVHGVHTPTGRVNTFYEEPSPELAGVIGVVLSDGTRYMHRQSARYRIRLAVKDRDYAEAFGRDLAKVLCKRKPYEPHWSNGRRLWITEASSIRMYKVLDRPWQELRQHIEANRACIARFLRRFFDGEGGARPRRLTVHNTDRELLLYIERLLRRYFGIHATGPHKSTRAGYRFRNPKNGKTYATNKQSYYLYVPVRSLSIFQRYVGFTIKRKQLLLIRGP